MKTRATAVLVLAAALGTALPAAPASAQDGWLRCGVNLIRVGDRRATVRESCGEPNSIETKTYAWRRYRTVREEWTYDLGPSELVRVLSFDATADRLLGITIGDRGR